MFIWEFYFIEKLAEKGKKKYGIILIIIGILLANFHSSVYPVYFVMYLPYIASFVMEKLNIKVFKTEIVNKIKIVSPYMYEKIDELSFEIEDSEEKAFGKYYVEIAIENRFYNTVYTAEVSGTNFTLHINPDIKPGQYYIRVRAQANEDQYGPWSNIATFIYKEEPEPEFPIDKLGGDKEIPSAFDDLYNARAEIFDENILADQAAEDIEVEQDLEILTYPENGVTPEDNQFVFEFDKSLDPTSIESIIVIRKNF